MHGCSTVNRCYSEVMISICPEVGMQWMGMHHSVCGQPPHSHFPRCALNVDLPRREGHTGYRNSREKHSSSSLSSTSTSVMSCTTSLPDEGIIASRCSEWNSALFHRQIPICLVMLGVIALILSLSSSSSSDRYQHGFASLFICATLALVLRSAGHYLCTEVGRLTFDGIHKSCRALPPAKTRTFTLIALLLCDWVFIPALLFAESGVLDPSSWVATASRVLLLHPQNHYHGDGGSSDTSTCALSKASFAAAVVIGTAVSCVGSCCVVPAFSQRPKGIRKVIAKVVSVATVWSVIPVSNALMSSIPCRQSSSSAVAKMIMCDQTICGSASHNAFAFSSALLLLVFGLCWHSAVQQLRLLDDMVVVSVAANTAEAVDESARCDPLVLTLSSGCRAATVIACALRLDPTSLLIIVVTTQVVQLCTVSMLFLSSIHMINSLAVMATVQQLWTALLLSVTLSSSSSAAPLKSVFGVEVIWCFISVANVVVFLWLHHRRHGWSFFDRRSIDAEGLTLS